jgi:hypothetical protein
MPTPAMMPYEDIFIQLVELPALSEEHSEPATGDNVRNADLALVVVDLASQDPLEQFTVTTRLLERMKIRLSKNGAGEDSGWNNKKTLVVANKNDLDEDAVIFSLMKELWESDIPLISVSADTGENLQRLKAAIFERLDVLRIYSKEPGKPKASTTPFTMKVGSTLLEFAAQVHKDFAENLKFAKVWGSSEFPGQNVSNDHVLADGDIVELHL